MKNLKKALSLSLSSVSILSAVTMSTLTVNSMLNTIDLKACSTADEHDTMAFVDGVLCFFSKTIIHEQGLTLIRLENASEAYILNPEKRLFYLEQTKSSTISDISKIMFIDDPNPYFLASKIQFDNTMKTTQYFIPKITDKYPIIEFNLDGLDYIVNTEKNIFAIQGSSKSQIMFINHQPYTKHSLVQINDTNYFIDFIDVSYGIPKFVINKTTFLLHTLNNIFCTFGNHCYDNISSITVDGKTFYRDQSK